MPRRYTLTHDDLPKPLPGFRIVSEASAFVFSQGETAKGTALVARAELRVLGRGIVRAALLGTVQSGGRPNEKESAESAYRALFDHLLFSPAPPDVVSILIVDGAEEHVDILWRLAKAMEAQATIGVDDIGGTRIDIFRSGRPGALAALLALRPPIAMGGLTTRRLFARFDSQGGARRLLVLARDVRAPAPHVHAPEAVQYDEATAREVQTLPLSFGLGLSTTSVDPSVRRQFVGRLDGRVVFRMVLSLPPTAIEGLVPVSIGAALAEPVGLVSQCATLTRFRGLSIYPAGLQWLARWAQEHDLRTLVLLIEPGNTPSIRGAKKAGFLRVGEITVPR